MKAIKLFAWTGVLATLLFAALAVAPDQAEAKRAGGGSSVGSRGTRSFSSPAPATATPRSATPQQPAAAAPATPAGPAAGLNQGAAAKPAAAAPAPAAPARSGWGSALMGGLGGLMLGGMLGSLLSGAGFGGGFGGLEMLLLAGAGFMAYRMFRSRSAGQPAEMPAQAAGGYYQPNQPLPGGSYPVEAEEGLPNRFTTGGAGGDVQQGLAHIASMDGGFDEGRFVEGAKACFQMVQDAWGDSNFARLRPLLTERLMGVIQQQAAEREQEGRRDVVDQVRFQSVEVTEAWQEAGEDWLTVHFQVEMLEYATDTAGKVVEGSADTPVAIEEFWTFTRPVGARDPNWKLAAIQQPGEVARSV